jgi:glycosyltransferase involved in cell wall biosynthesis
MEFDPSGPLEVVGYLSMSAGVGESARLCADALASRGLPIRLRDVSTDPESPEAIGWHGPRESAMSATSRILHLNPPMLPRAVASIGFGKFARAFNIGYWAWELEEIPSEWKNAFRYMNAIFVPSVFTRDALVRHTDRPVLVVPHPVTEKTAEDAIRCRFSIPEDAFLVSSVFSAGSSINRKNPQAVIKAFQIFRAHHPNSFLLMKASGNPATDEALRTLLAETEGMPDVKIVTDRLPSSMIQGIIRQSDAYLSLHRSEGFGLTVAEAILHETPVVSTGWSGTVDFCDPANTWNTRYNLIPVVDDHPEFASLAHARWADADCNHAAQQLAVIAQDPAGAKAKAARARAFLKSYLAANTYETALRALVKTQSASLRSDRLTNVMHRAAHPGRNG